MVSHALITTNQTNLWTRRQTAEYLGIKEQTLAFWATIGRGPRYVKVGRAVRYRLSDIEAYLKANTVGADVSE